MTDQEKDKDKEVENLNTPASPDEATPDELDDVSGGCGAFGGCGSFGLQNDPTA
jgi:hypothetical protein